jgi:hypothetical protein
MSLIAPVEAIDLSSEGQLREGTRKGILCSALRKMSGWRGVLVLSSLAESLAFRMFGFAFIGGAE